MDALQLSFEHHQTLKQRTSVPFRCQACGFGGFALVDARGTGSARSFLLLNSQRAQARAHAEALEELEEAAAKISRLAACPECGVAHESTARWRAKLALQLLGSAVFGAVMAQVVVKLRLVSFDRIGWGPTLFAAALLAVTTNWGHLWKWRVTGKQVRVLTAAEHDALIGGD